MDISVIIVAALSLAGTLAGSYFSNSKQTALMGYRMEQLEKKVEKHNTIVERMYKVEKDMNTAFIKIDELRNDLNSR